MSLDIKSVEFFVRVAALGAIGKAGMEFGYSPTAASQRIQNLEQALGAKLLNRTTRSVSLTRDGELFLSHAKKIVADVEDAVTDLQGTGKIIKGELRVTASASFGRRYIAPYIGEFLKEHPEVSIQLELSDSMFDIVRHGFDLALRIGVLEPSSLLAKKIAESPRLLVASKEYVKEYGAPQKAEDLISHNCLLLGEIRTWQIKDKIGKVSEIKVSGNFATNYGEAITEAALSGIGIALKSKWDVLEQLKSGELVEILPNHKLEPEWGIWAVRPPGKLMSARVRIFIDYIETKLVKALK
ncbi:MAG: LysR family transcriptional regulator [Hyphomicrobiales bacterium]